MSKPRFAVWLVLTVVSVGLGAGCGHDPLPVTPSTPVPDDPVPTLSADYTLTLEAASNCDSDIPGGEIGGPFALELRRRSYNATMNREGSRLQIVLTEPRFEDWTDNARRLSGTVTKAGANFVIGTDPAGWFSDLVERLPDGSTLQISGSAQTTGSAGVLSGAFSGYFRHSSTAGGWAVCGASRFTLAPR